MVGVTAVPIEPSTMQGTDPGPTIVTEQTLAEVLAEVVGAERVSVEANFFEDLGADSMVMARFCARVRKRAELPSVSMKDVYRHPTVRALAAAVAPPGDAPTPVSENGGVASPKPLELHRASTSQYLLCGALQFLVFLAAAYVSAVVSVTGYGWIAAGTGFVDSYLRTAAFAAASFLGLCSLPILAKWVLIGRWKPQRIPVWSLAYVRFWTVKTLIRANPMVLFAGSPLYVLYLRALGANIGRGVTIFSPHAPVCTDLLTVGDGTVIRKEAFLACYRAHAGVIETGPVTLGKNVYVGEATVIDIGASLGDGAQLGHSSSLHSGQAVPDGERWHGSPAQRSEVDYRRVEPTDCPTRRRAAYSLVQALNALVVGIPLLYGGLIMLVNALPHSAGLGASGSLGYTSWTFYWNALSFSFVLFFGSLFVGLLFVVTVPRVLDLAITPDRVYRLYGFHYWVHRAIARVTNRRAFTHLFGDSSFIVYYLRCLGYSLTPVVQTGSNFGMQVKHESPFLSSIGTGTVVADGLSILNADFSSTSFRMSRTTIGRHSFLGNNVVYPPGARTGDNCLLGTKVMVPIEGELREGIGLLGSPSFEIPRSVQRDSRFDHLKSGDELARRLAAKTRHNVVTMALYLLLRWIYLFGLVLLGLGAAALYPSVGMSAFGLASAMSLVVSVLYFVGVERAVQVSHPLSPQFCSIYDPYFWWHERFWKLPAMILPLVQTLNGTPFKGMVWRMLGVRVGRRLFDDGCWMPEKTLVTIGDDVTLNTRSIIQCHSQEDDTFKSDRIAIGAGCTVGVGGWVHYGTTMGDGSVLEPDSFLMKGEEVPPGARWGGNPAREMGDERAATTTTAERWSALSEAVTALNGRSRRCSTLG